MNWYSLEPNEVLKQQESSWEGLTEYEVQKRLHRFGKNTLPEKSKKPPWLIFLRQFSDFMILVLILAAVVSGFIGDLTDSIIILVIVFLNAVMGFLQEFNAEKVMQALKQMSAAPASVKRSGKSKSVPSDTIVPGDIVLLEAGNMIPADLRLLESNSLRVDESALTGESQPIDKISQKLDGDLPLPADQLNMVFRGTTVIYGRGCGIVVATGAQTELGRIAHLLQEPDRLTPLQKRMADFGKKLSIIIILLCGLFFLNGFLRGEDAMHMLLVAISLAVAAIPEALPALIAVALSIGARRLARQNALVRSLPAVETLGSVTYICTDKTGTITQNKMQVVSVIHAAQQPSLHDRIPGLAVLMLLNNDAPLHDDGDAAGDPTEIAMVRYVRDTYSRNEWLQVRDKMKRVAEIPFDSDRKCMTTFHQMENGFLQITKGAAEVLLEMMKPGGEEFLKRTEELAAQGIRIIVFGTKMLRHVPETLSPEQTERDLSFAGMAGVIDPPREAVKEAIEECKTAGIQPVMITGDHPSTATAIAKEVGIFQTGSLVLTGKELAAMDEDTLAGQAEKTHVYARVSPEQKLLIVKGLQKKNHFVAMTGDGVNDAPSLKRADIGVAMGRSGTQVSREASDIILLDDNFATIVRAVGEGRRIFDNIRRFTKYVLTCNSAELCTLFLAPLMGLPIPLLPIHILFINLVTDGLPGLALGFEKAESNVMKRPPRDPGENLFARGLGWHVIWVGLLMALFTLLLQAYMWYGGSTNWQTMVFTALCLMQMGHVLGIRSESEFLYRHGFFSNPKLILSVLLTFIFQMAIVYLPVANRIFKTQPLSLPQLLVCIGFAILIFHAVEAEKWVRQKTVHA